LGALELIAETKPAALASRFSRAASWLSESKTLGLAPRLQFLSLFSAVRAVLGDRASGAGGTKGEVLALRSMLLGMATGDGFVDPIAITDLYERRSSITHGSEFDLGEDHLSEINFIATRVLFGSAQFVSSEPAIRSFSDLLRAIETADSLQTVHRWLSRQSGPTYERLQALADIKANGSVAAHSSASMR